MARSAGPEAGLTLRTRFGPADVETIARLHGAVYSREYGFDATFETYVREPLARFERERPANGRLWIAEYSGQVAGSVAIVPAEPEVAQLRWFLVTPEARGRGIGTRLLGEAVGFARGAGYRQIVLWTVSTLSAAVRLYRSAGFRKVEARPGRRWGVEVVEERYHLELERPQAGEHGDTGSES